jgi:hypothetical protein
MSGEAGPLSPSEFAHVGWVRFGRGGCRRGTPSTCHRTPESGVRISTHRATCSQSMQRSSTRTLRILTREASCETTRTIRTLTLCSRESSSWKVSRLPRTVRRTRQTRSRPRSLAAPSSKRTRRRSYPRSPPPKRLRKRPTLAFRRPEPWARLPRKGVCATWRFVTSAQSKALCKMLLGSRSVALQLR